MFRSAQACKPEADLGRVAARVHHDRFARPGGAHEVAVGPDRAELELGDVEAHGEVESIHGRLHSSPRCRAGIFVKSKPPAAAGGFWFCDLPLVYFAATSFGVGKTR